METLNDVSSGVPDLPYQLWYEALPPTHSLKRKLAAYFVLHPICGEHAIQ
jgi:hypothetical protein